MLTPQDAPTSIPLVEIRELRKSYGIQEAVCGIDLRVYKGEIFALLGPNGAGKTTTIEIMEGHLPRTSGLVSVLGYDPAGTDRGFRERVGIVLQSTIVEPYLTVEESINLFRGYYQKPLPLNDILDAVDLNKQRRTRVKRLSGGQQRKLDLAIGLAGDPELLFLDEPTTGFDPSARRGAWRLIKKLKTMDKTIILTTHYMDEAEFLADRVGIMANGKIIAVGTPSELVKGNTTTIRFRLQPGSFKLPKDLQAIAAENNGVHTITTSVPSLTLYQLTRWAVKQDIELKELTVGKPSLEDIFIDLTDSVTTIQERS